MVSIEITAEIVSVYRSSSFAPARLHFKYSSLGSAAMRCSYKDTLTEHHIDIIAQCRRSVVMSPESSHAQVAVSSTALPLPPARRRSTEAIDNLLDITTDSGKHQSGRLTQDKSADEATQRWKRRGRRCCARRSVRPGEQEVGACKERMCTVSKKEDKMYWPPPCLPILQRMQS